MTQFHPVNRPFLLRHNLFLLLLLAIAALVFATILSGSLPLSSGVNAAPLAAVDAGRWPLAFVPNEGQSDAAVRYQAHVPGANFFFTGEGLAFTWAGAEEGTASGELQLAFLGKNSEVLVSGQEAQLGVVNYILGSDPEGWQTGILTYAVLAYEELYPGVRLKYGGQGNSLTAVFEIAAGTDVEQIAWRVDGAKAVLDESGALQLVPEVGDGPVLTLEIPRAWQIIGGQKVPVAVAYELGVDGEVGFMVGEYDGERPLTVSSMSNFLPPTAANYRDYIFDIDVSADGRAYIIGATRAPNLPLANPIQSQNQGLDDAFVTVFAPDGKTLLYSTYLGGSKSDFGANITVDTVGQVYVSGNTNSLNFPLANPMQSNLDGNGDTFVTVLAPDGQSLVYSTYLGGGSLDSARDSTVDNTGRFYITGETLSADFPLFNPFQNSKSGNWEGFVTVFAPDGQSLLYSTYLGGAFNDNPWSIAVDDNGRAYITGSTWSLDFPLANPFQANHSGGFDDVFVTVFAPDGQSLVYSTYLGGVSVEEGRSIVVDNNGRAYLAGWTESADFPLANPLQATPGGNEDAFVTVFTPDGQSLVYSTYLGGNGFDTAYGIAVDGTGQAYVTGNTSSPDFQLANPFQANLGGGNDAFVSVLAPDGQSFSYSTYLGGTGDDFAGSIGLDGGNRAYVAGQTTSEDFPLTTPFQATFEGDRDGFVSALTADGSALVYSTYFHNGPPSGPTSVGATGFTGGGQGVVNVLWLMSGLCLLFLVGYLLWYWRSGKVGRN